MKNSSKFSILDVLNDYFNKNEETKVSWDPLHEAATEKFKEGAELTDEAKREATERSFDVSVYKTILTYLKNSNYDNFQNKIAREYEKGKFDQDKLFKEKNINRLASAYENHKEYILVEKLLLLNPGGEFTEVKEKKGGSSVEETIQRKTTFVHKLFENNARKEGIIYFFKELEKLSGKNPDLIQSYLALSDESGKSITAILQEKSLDAKYVRIFPEIERLCPSLYRRQNQRQNSDIVVDTHTGSVHESVDKSFAELALNYDPVLINVMDNNRVVSVTRNEDWNKGIDNNLLELQQRLTELTTSDEAIDELVSQTLSAGEDKGELCRKFKFQAEAALRMVEGLKSGRYGNHYHVSANDPVSCGLTPKEIVAIGYASLAKRDLWKNKDQEPQQFMYFIKNMYIAKRGYNIDRHGDDEWRVHPEVDDNKCTGGTINQIAYGLVDNDCVNVYVINSDTMLPILSKKLKEGVLKDICKNEDHKNLITTWLNGGVLSNDLRDGILERLKNDNDFKKEFSVTEIDNIAPQVLNKLNESQREDIKNSLAEILTNQANDGLLNSAQVHSFTFDKEKGYVLALEQLCDVNKAAFRATLDRELRSSINGMDLNSRDAKKMNLIINLLLSSQNQEMRNEVQERFQEHIKDFDQLQKDQYFILMAEDNNTHVLMSLIQSGANINARDNRFGHYGKTALHYVAQNNNIEAIKVLVAAGIDKEVKDNRGYTALNIAAVYDSLKAIRSLIEMGVDKEAKNNDGEAALHMAVRSRRIEAIKALIEMGVDKEAKNNDGETALHMAARRNNIEAIKALIEMGVDKEAKNNDGETALHMAAEHNRIEAIKALIEMGADINVKNNYGSTALHRAAGFSNAEAIKALIEMGVDKEAKNNDGEAALHIVAYSDNAIEIKALIEMGADINVKNNYGSTALHIAACCNNAIAIKALIEMGADISAKNNYGVTALDFVCARGDTEIIKAFLTRSDLYVDSILEWVLKIKTTPAVIKLLVEDGRIETLDLEKIDAIPDTRTKDLLQVYFYKSEIIKSLKTTSANSELSVKISGLNEDVQSELAKQLQPEIRKLASSNLGHNIGKIISSFPEGSRMKYFEDVVIESMMKIDNNKIQKMLQPFDGSEKISLYTKLTEAKKKTHVERINDERIDVDDITVGL